MSFLDFLFGKHGDFGSTSTTGIDAQLQQLISDSLPASAFERGTGSAVLTGGLDDMFASSEYWKKLLSGDRDTIQQAIAPQAGRIINQYDAARKATLETNPRSGARAQTLSELPFRQISDVNSLTAGIQPAAANALTGIGTTKLAQGSNLLRGGTQDLQSILNLLLNQRGETLKTGMYKEDQRTKNMQMLVQALGALAAGL
jgi:hypothetical protein